MSSDPEPSGDLEALLREGETIRWHARPRASPIYLSFLVKGAVIGLFVVPWIGFMLVAGVGLDVGSRPVQVGLGLIGLYVLGVLAAARQRVHHAEYAATDQRLIQFGGIVGRDYSSTTWDKVRDVEVSVGVFDKPFDTGTVHLTVAGTGGPTGGAGVEFAFIPDPYAQLQEVEAAGKPTGQAPSATGGGRAVGA